MVEICQAGGQHPRFQYVHAPLAGTHARRRGGESEGEGTIRFVTCRIDDMIPCVFPPPLHPQDDEQPGFYRCSPVAFCTI